MLKTDKQKRLKASILALALASMPLGVHAAGVGKLTVMSALGQPLRAEIELTASREEYASLSARVASADAFKNAGIEYSSALAAIRFTLDRRTNGQPYLQVISDRPLNEPFIDMLVEVNWSSGRLVREFTFLLDPPDVFKRPGSPAPVAVPEVAREAAPLTAVPAREPEKAVVTPKAAEPTAALPAAEKAPKRLVADEAMTATKGVTTRPAEKFAAAGAATRLVKKGDTLGKIATEAKPEGVSLDQMLVALFRTNQDAFDAGNMNRLRAGKILSLPDKETVAGITQGEARKVVVAQAVDFNAYRQKLAGVVAAAPAREEAPKQVATGKIAPRVEEKVPAPAGKDKLEVSRTESAKAGKGRGAVAVEEDLIARDKALKDANSRIAELEKNINDLKTLTAMKSAAGAKFQEQTPAAKLEAAPPVAAKKPEPAPAPEPAPIPVAPKMEEAPKPADVVPATPPPAPPVAVKRPAPPPPATVPPPGFVEENPAIVFGGGGVLALLAGYLGFNAWRRKRKAAAEATGEFSSSSVFGTAGGQSVDTDAGPLTDFSQASMADASGEEGVDPVKEADVYMAYGRDGQAEEILLEALRTDPSRVAIHAKLLEIYASRKAVRQFETVARDLHGLTGGNGADWDKAAALGRSLDPENSLYEQGGAVIVPSTIAAAAETVVMHAPPIGGAATETMVMPGQLSQMAAAAEEVAAAAPPEDEVALLDFDLDLGAPATATTEELAPAEPAPAVEEAMSLDFDLDLTPPATAEPAVEPEAEASSESTGLDFDLGTTTFEVPPATEESQPVAEKAVESESTGLDFDLGTTAFEAPPVTEASPTASQPETDDNATGLDFDLGTVSFEAPAVQEPAATTAEATGAGAGALDFDFDLGDNTAIETPAASIEPPAPIDALEMPAIELPAVATAAATELPVAELKMPEIDLSAISLDLDLPAEPEAVSPAVVEPMIEDNPEVATKLELAQAYEEMGDKEGARELLNEVLNEGSPSQQETARNKLAQLG